MVIEHGLALVPQGRSAIAGLGPADPAVVGDGGALHRGHDLAPVRALRRHRSIGEPREHPCFGTGLQLRANLVEHAFPFLPPVAFDRSFIVPDAAMLEPAAFDPFPDALAVLVAAA